MRLVCRLWNSRVTITRVFERQMELTLGGSRDLGAHTTRMYEGLALLQHPNSTLPYPTTVHIDYSLFQYQGKGMRMFQRSFVKFLGLISEEIKDLRLHQNLKTGDYHIVNYQRSYFDDTMGEHFPRLAKLTIDCDNDHMEYYGLFTSLAVYVMKNAPRLTEFSLFCEDREDLHREALEVMILENIPLTVQKLRIDICISVFAANAIGRRQFKNLLHLDLGLFNAALTATELYQLLSKFCDNLVSLRIQECSCPVKFPVFPSLKTFDISFDEHRSEESAEADQLEPFTHLFPVATTFNGLYTWEDFLEGIFPAGFWAPEVLDCTLPMGHNEYEQILNLVQGFANVRRLTLMPSDEPESCKMLTPVFQWMELLEDLRICFQPTYIWNGARTCVDSLLTGITPEMCRRIKRAKRIDCENIDLQSVKTLPGVTDLKRKML